MTRPEFPRKSASENAGEHGAVGRLSPSELGPLVAPWIPPKQQSKHGGSTKRTLVFTWAGIIPQTNGQGVIWETPYDVDGSSLSFTIERAAARMEQNHIADQILTLQKASGGDVAFVSPSTITAVTILAGHYRGAQLGLSVALVSGDLVGLFFTQAGSLSSFSLELLGTT